MCCRYAARCACDHLAAVPQLPRRSRTDTYAVRPQADIKLSLSAVRCTASLLILSISILR
jgi:hypothetical protein